MGQRLNIEIKNNEKVLANCYYHWSAYSTSSLQITKDIINYIYKNDVGNDHIDAIEVLIATGSSFSKQAWDKAVEMGVVSGKMSDCNGRNGGLIAIDKENMEETRYWEEGRIEINLEEKTFNFECAREKNYIEQEDIWERISDMFYEIKDIDSSYNIPFSKIDILLNGIKEAEKKYNGRFFFSCYCFDSIY